MSPPGEVARDALALRLGIFKTGMNPHKAHSKDPPSADAPVEMPRSTPRAGTRRARLLVVDDEPQIGNTLRLLLDPDHEVIPVTSAREALERIKNDRSFDIIFCDLMMPEVSGTDFYKQLSTSAPELLDRLVFMTGGVFSTRTNAFLEKLPNPCIEKPFDIGALLALINERMR
jgi:CheY-like chemotaxis protein